MPSHLIQLHYLHFQIKQLPSKCRLQPKEDPNLEHGRSCTWVLHIGYTYYRILGLTGRITVNLILVWSLICGWSWSIKVSYGSHSLQSWERKWVPLPISASALHTRNVHQKELVESEISISDKVRTASYILYLLHYVFRIFFGPPCLWNILQEGAWSYQEASLIFAQTRSRVN